MKKRLLWGAAGILVLVVLVGLFWTGESDQSTDLLVHPVVAPFQVTVSATGELKAQRSVMIFGPENTRQAQIWELKLIKLIPEGTVVQKGQFVAELDRSELLSKLRDAEINLQKAQSQYEQTSLDTMLTLSKSRDDQVNLKYAMEEARLQSEQAAYEAPSVQRKAQIDYERAERAYDQAVINYRTQVQQAVAKMREVGAELSKNQKVFDDLASLGNSFTIMAPDNGMVIYRRNWRGERTTEGGTISAWEPIVAELPDLSSMESITYVNEVDIQKLKAGQKVDVTMDADPSKKLTGKVNRIANIGEQRPNSDSKVFEVSILINESDTTLRPAMTTGNLIYVSVLPNMLQVPLEAIHSRNDSMTYVYVKKGSRPVRQEVRLGLFNDNAAIVEQGVTTRDEVYLSMPADTAGLEFIALAPAAPEKNKPQPARQPKEQGEKAPSKEVALKTSPAADRKQKPADR